MNSRMTPAEQAVWNAAYGTAFAQLFDRDACTMGFAQAIAYRRATAMRAESVAYNAVHALSERQRMNSNTGVYIEQETDEADLCRDCVRPVECHEQG